MEQIVLPIFFLVEPAHVRNKTGAFGEALNELKEKKEKEKAQMTENERENIEKELKKWEDALTQLGEISGFPLTERDNQAEFINDFVLKVSKEYVGSSNIISKGLFGMHSRMEKLKSYVYKSKSGAEFIGICGMGGIGKTTIARTFYELESSQFESISFLENVKGNYLKSLKEKLLSDTLSEECTTNCGTIRNRLCRKKALIVIDDVDHLDQLETLVGERDWYGSGSRIIITTRDRHLLIAHGVEEIYDVEPLYGDEGFQLFTWKAGVEDVHRRPDEYVEYKRLSQRVVAYADGLPLALKVLGSALRGKYVEELNDQLERLKHNPNKEIMEVLQISFDGLEDEDMNIFLLIACFFRGSGHKDFLTSIRKKIGFPKISIGNLSDNDKDYVTSILKKCSFNPIIGIRNLGDKSLLSIKDNKIWVHDLLEEMGWKILEKKSLTEKLGRQIKLWNVSNVSYVLKNCTAIEEIEAVVCFDLSKKCPTKETFLNFLDVLTKMKKLKLLKLDSYSLSGLSSVLPILQSLSNELDNQSDLPMLQYLSNELLILQWVWCPFQYFPLSFQPTQLVEVDMSYSRICRLWGTVEHLPKLRSVRLFGCINLTEIFNDFTLVPNLEVLDLGHCRKLSKIDLSIQFLGKLIHLDLRGCISLENLPPSLRGMVSLKILYLGGCHTLRDLPKDIVYLKSLELLNI